MANVQRAGLAQPRGISEIRAIRGKKPRLTTLDAFGIRLFLAPQHPALFHIRLDPAPCTPRELGA